MSLAVGARAACVNSTEYQAVARVSHLCEEKLGVKMPTANRDKTSRSTYHINTCSGGFGGGGRFLGGCWGRTGGGGGLRGAKSRGRGCSS